MRGCAGLTANLSFLSNTSCFETNGHIMNTTPFQYEKLAHRVSKSPYRYPTLHRDAPSIRLINLFRGSGQSPLRCNFRVAYLDHGEQYAAVSYTWGKKVRNRPIVIGDQTFLVSATVEDILMRLRDPQRDRLLWLDLICIYSHRTVTKYFRM
jgi:hypothetical protein